MKLFKKNTVLKAITNKISISTVCALLVGFSTFSQDRNQTEEQWKKMKTIIQSITYPVFKTQTYNIVDYGAQSSTTFDNTTAISKAIQECSKNGGGIVVVPKGKYLSHAIHLEDNVNLHLDKDAEILFSTNPKDYYPLVHTSFEGTELMNYSPLVYAYKKKNIAITGEGTLNGQASSENWWPWCSAKQYGWKKGDPSQADPLNRLRLVEMAENNIPVSERIFGEEHYLRPNFVEFFECKTALIQGITIINAPFWVLHPIKSENVIVDGVTVNSHGPNNDGCDPEYSKNVIIKNCTFNTGDDCIAIKSGRDADGRRVAMKSENIIIQNCTMIDGHGGVTIGSEISGGVSNVFVENCKMDSPNLDIAIRLKTNSKRGGLIEKFYVRNLEIGQVKTAVLKADMFYNVHGNQIGTFIPRMENIYLENIKVKNGGQFGVLAKGYKESEIKNITFKDVIIETVKEPYSIENVNNLKFINTYINGKKMKE